MVCVGYFYLNPFFIRAVLIMYRIWSWKETRSFNLNPFLAREKFFLNWECDGITALHSLRKARRDVLHHPAIITSYMICREKRTRFNLQ